MGPSEAYANIAARMTPEKAAKMAARRTQFEETRAPLLASAGLIPATDPEDYIVQAAENARGWERLHRRFLRSARLIRHFVGLRVGSDRLAELDAQLSRRWHADVPVSIVTFWRGELAALIGREKPGVNPVVWERKLQRALRERAKWK